MGRYSSTRGGLAHTRARPVGICDKQGKKQFKSSRDARTEGKSIRKRLKAKLDVYLCRWCGYFHLGHNRPPSQRKPEPGQRNRISGRN